MKFDNGEVVTGVDSMGNPIRVEGPLMGRVEAVEGDDDELVYSLQVSSSQGPGHDFMIQLSPETARKLPDKLLDLYK